MIKTKEVTKSMAAEVGMSEICFGEALEEGRVKVSRTGALTVAPRCVTERAAPGMSTKQLEWAQSCGVSVEVVGAELGRRAAARFAFEQGEVGRFEGVGEGPGELGSIAKRLRELEQRSKRTKKPSKLMALGSCRVSLEGRRKRYTVPIPAPAGLRLGARRAVYGKRRIVYGAS